MGKPICADCGTDIQETEIMAVDGDDNYCHRCCTEDQYRVVPIVDKDKTVWQVLEPYQQPYNNCSVH